MYKGGRLTICDRLTQIKESIYYIQQWSKEINCADDFLASMDKVMVFNACVMRLQVIGEQVGKLLFLQPSPLSEYKSCCFYNHHRFLNIRKFLGWLFMICAILFRMNIVM